MTEPYPIRRAREAYRAYGQTTDFKNYQGNPMPAWDDLTEKIREAWVAASTAAAPQNPARRNFGCRRQAASCRNHFIADLSA
jgi:hypothetical protein